MKQSKIAFYTLLASCTIILSSCVGDGASGSNTTTSPQSTPLNTAATINHATNDSMQNSINLAGSTPPCTNQSCTKIWSLDNNFDQVNLGFVHPGIRCDGTVFSKISMTGSQRVLTIVDTGNRHTCYSRIENVFRNNPNHVYLEATITVSTPQGGSPTGAWPALWTSGEPWPTSGEIDIAEGNVNSNFTQLETWTNLHGRNGANQGPSIKYNPSKLTDFGQPHTYGLELLKDPASKHIEIAAYVDGVQMTYFNNAGAVGADADDYQDIINGFYTHAIVLDADDNNVPVSYTMSVTNLNVYTVN